MRKILIVFLAFWTLLNFTESKQQKHLKLLHKVCDLNAFCYDDEKPFVLVKEDDKACPEPNDQLPRSRSKNRNLNEDSEEDFDAEEMEFKKVSQFLGNCTEGELKVCVGCHRRFRIEASEERIANIKCEDNWLFKNKSNCGQRELEEGQEENGRNRRRKNRRCNRDKLTQIIDVCNSTCDKS